MRVLIASIVAGCIFLLPQVARAGDTYRLNADRVAFYTNLFILQGTGNVHLDLGNGREITADFFSMDTHGNRFIAAGNVRFHEPGIDATFVALSADLVAQRAYAIAANGTLEHVSFAGNDFAHPRPDAQIPNDAFELPVISDPASKLGRKIVIGTRNYLRYGSCTTQIIGGTGLYLPIPDCYVDVGDDPNLAQSALSGSNAGGAINLTGNANAVSAIFINYDNVDKLYAALQQNITSKDAWAVLALTASRHPGLSIVGSATPGGAFGVRVSGQWQSVAQDVTDGVTSFRYTDVRLAQALPFGYVEAFASTGSDSGSGPLFVPTQQTSAQIDLATSNVPIGKAAFGMMRAGYGQEHNPFGLQQLGGVNYTDLAYQLYRRRAERAGHPDRRPGCARTFRLAALASETIQQFTIPHETTTTTTSIGLSKPLGSAQASLSYGVANVADRYAVQQLAYPAIVPGFDGLATFRTLTLGLTFDTSPAFVISLQARSHDDFPKPGLNLFPVVTAAPLGTNPYQFQLGQPPGDVTLAFRLRINPQLTLDISDTQYINARGWPTNTFQFLLRP